ncbi:phytoene dehydrogenase [Ilyonectria robusta]
MRSPTVIVVGAGAGGIATAARLAKKGATVTVVEKHEFVGGRCSLIHRNGYRFDQGPSLLLMPEVFHQTFEDLDTSLEKENVQLMKCDTNYNIWFEDKSCFQVSTDLSRMGKQIEHHEGKQGLQQFLAFMKESGNHYDLSMAHVMSRNFSHLFSMLRPQFLKSVFTLHPFESVYSRASRYFKSEKVRRVFTFASMYLGMSPFDAPGTYSLLQYTELAHGIAYPIGGFQKVLDALAKVGRRLGVKYRLGTPVSSIIVSGNIARGVRLESGEELYADIVVVNADLVYAYNNLLPPSSYSLSLTRRPASCSSISFFWSFDRVIPELQAHNVFLANEYRESFDAIFKRHSLPEEPSFYVNVPSRIDPSAAPTGKDAVVILIPVGHISDDALNAQDWDSLVTFAREFVLQTIESRTGARGLRDCLLHESVDTPLTWRSKFNLDRGAILGLSHSFFNVLSFRPKNKHRDIGGLYFVGASTHPGTGVPVCLASGKIVSEQITQDWSRTPRAWWKVAWDILRVTILVMTLSFSAWLSFLPLDGRSEF